jgi:SAM-dependent methyltransferase
LLLAVDAGARHRRCVLDRDEIRARILELDTPERREIHARHFAGGAPRKLTRAMARLDLARARVLDVGCGHGVYLLHFSKTSVGVDRSVESVAFARSIGLAAEVRDVERDGWQCDLGTFDAVWLCDILVHLREPERFLEDLHPLLAPRGRVVITEWLWPESERLARLLATAIPGGRETLSHSEHVHRFSRRSLSEMLARAGFEIAESYNHSFASPLVASITNSFWPPRTVVAVARRARENAAP